MVLSWALMPTLGVIVGHVEVVLTFMTDVSVFLININTPFVDALSGAFIGPEWVFAVIAHQRASDIYDLVAVFTPVDLLVARDAVERVHRIVIFIGFALSSTNAIVNVCEVDVWVAVLNALALQRK